MSLSPGTDIPSDWRSVIAAIPEAEKTPLVRLLLQVIEQQSQRIEFLEAKVANLEAEIVRLKGGPVKKPPASNSKPSELSKPPKSATEDGKRPGSAKRSKTKDLPIHSEVAVPPSELPPGSSLVRRDPFVVQDLLVEVHNTRYQIETWRTPNGEEIRGQLPAGIRGHFGAGLVQFVMQQHYAAHVPQSRIYEELEDFGIDISAGQINNILTEKVDDFHAEKDALLPTALQACPVLNVDDSGAPHDGEYGSCLCLCNEFFTSFHSSDSKERGKFLDVLRCGHRDYVLDEHSGKYLLDQGLPAKIWKLFAAEPPPDSPSSTAEPRIRPQTFADEAAWNQHLDCLGIDNAKHRQTLTEAALLGSAIAHGLPADLKLVSDASSIYAMFVHGLCWIHQERNLAKLVPCGTEQVQAHETVLTALWQLYKDLKTNRATPIPERAAELRTRFDTLVNTPIQWPELAAALVKMAKKKDDLLRVLDHPELPLHTNTVERAFRDWATKRKISAGTRSEVGRRCRDTFMSLKSTCRKLGVRFWNYLNDRLKKENTIPQLSELLVQKSASSATI